VGQGKVVAVRGELPVRIAPGDVVRYADLRGPGRAFATLDYGSGKEIQAIYVGSRIDASEAGIDATKTVRAAERHAQAERLSCPNCGGEVKRLDPVGCPRVTCASCGALLDASSRTVRVLGTAMALTKRPAIPLGSDGV